MPSSPFRRPQLRRVHAALTMAVVLATSLASAAALTSAAEAKVSVGIGQQTPELFTDPYWAVLSAPDVRYITPWDTLSDPGQLSRLDQWMAGADAAGARVLLGLRGSLKPGRGRYLPTPAQYERAFRALRARYPRVRDFVPWNETNHPSAPTGRRPDRAAAYFNAAQRNCPGCNVAAGDVLDLGNMESWIRAYKRYLRFTPRIWSLHNYHDANALTSSGVRRLLRVTRGQVWMTETGGVVRMRVADGKRIIARNYGIKRAAAATTHILGLSKLSSRITRIYLYHWSAPQRFTTWDSGLLDARLRPRPAYQALRTWLTRARRARAAQ